MLVIENQEHFDKVVAFAKSIGKMDELQQDLDYLGTYASHRETRCRLYRDGSGPDFYFVMDVKKDGEWRMWFNGGLLFHGAHDGFGSGAGPTFAVTLTPTSGWSIHT